jgi:hypothetical protein
MSCGVNLDVDGVMVVFLAEICFTGDFLLTLRVCYQYNLGVSWRREFVSFHPLAAFGIKMEFV